MKKTKSKITALLAILMLTQSVMTVGADEVGTSTASVVAKNPRVVEPNPDPNDINPGKDSDTDFRLWKAPSEFIFSDIKFDQNIATSGVVVGIDESKATSTGSNMKIKDLAVGDLRTLKPGWHITAKISNGGKLAGTKTGETNHDILGATISFKTATGTWDVGENPHLWLKGTSDIDAGGSVTLNGTDAVVLNAPASKGYGYHGAKLSDVKLNIPASVVKIGYNYTGSVTWSLNNAPQ